MNNFEKLKNSARTDVAFEELDLRRFENSSTEFIEEYESDGLVVRKTYVSQKVSKEINKKSGLYYLIDSTQITDGISLDKIEKALIDILKDLFKFENISPKDKGLIVGLGNINVTPDSLGPLVCDNVMITHHLFKLEEASSLDKLSNVCAISPGVMGQTGLETSDIVKAIVDIEKIDYLIVVDSLASRSVKRVNKTIQATNAGISPGSGIGAKRKELSKESLKIPVIAIGVPTVVDLVTIVSDTLDKVSNHFDNQKHHPFKHFDNLSDRERRILFEEIIGDNNFMVTPKEIDAEIEDLSRVISNAIDKSLHSILDSKGDGN